MNPSHHKPGLVLLHPRWMLAASPCNPACTLQMLRKSLCTYLDQVHADKPEEVAMPLELLEIFCQGDPLLLGDGMFLNVQPKGRGGRTNKKQNNCDSFTSRAEPMCCLSSAPIPTFLLSRDQTKKSRVFNNIYKDKRLQVSRRTFIS